MKSNLGNATQVLRYIYAMLVIIAIAVVTVISSLYVEQQDEIATRNRIQHFHLESHSESDQLVREARMLRKLLQDAADFEVSDYSDGVDQQSPQIGYSGVLYTMGTRLVRLSALQDSYGGEKFVKTLARLSDRFSEIELAVRDSDVTPESITAIESLILITEQLDRLHSVSAEMEFREFGSRQSRRPRFLGILVVSLSFCAFAIWLLISSLYAALLRQKNVESALAESQERLHQRQKLDALGNLAGGIAHDFNNLLATILGHTRLLRENVSDDERLTASLEEIETAGLRAVSLTQQFLGFSGQKQICDASLDINGLIESMEEELRTIVGADVQLTCDYADEICAVELDPDQLKEVITNVMTNAREAMRDGGRITISTETLKVGAGDVEMAKIPQGNYVKLTISDTGIGMDNDMLQQLFDPYYSTKESAHGKGLGLSAVHGIIAGFNGHVLVNSVKGEGSQFDIYLPRADSTPADTFKQTITESDPFGTETVLIVDDDQQIRRLLASGLSTLGYRVLTASGGSEGLEICEAEPGEIDMIVTDIVMSEMNGPHFLSSALKLRPGAMAIYMSSYAEEAVLGFRRGNRETDTPLISKPFELESLGRLIRERLNRVDDP